jgi:hypothetical protein
LTPFEARAYIKAQKPCSLPPASRIQTAQTTDNTLQSWGRSPVQVLLKKRSEANTTLNNKATPLRMNKYSSLTKKVNAISRKDLD